MTYWHASAQSGRASGWPTRRRIHRIQLLIRAAGQTRVAEHSTLDRALPPFQGLAGVAVPMTAVSHAPARHGMGAAGLAVAVEAAASMLSWLVPPSCHAPLDEAAVVPVAEVELELLALEAAAEQQKEQEEQEEECMARYQIWDRPQYLASAFATPRSRRPMTRLRAPHRSRPKIRQRHGLLR